MRNATLILVIMLSFVSITVKSQMYILNEDFNAANGTTPPFDWSSITIVGEANDVWHFDNPGNLDIGFPVIEPFAIFDAAAVSDNGQAEEVALETPFFDASIGDFILLEFDHTFIPGDSVCKIQAYNGTSWFDVITYSDSIPVITHEVVDISTWAGGVTNAKLRFLWRGNGNGYWAFDNVRILAALEVDAGITSIDNPVAPVTQGVHDVNVTLYNYGSQPLTSALIKWSVNGAMQPSLNWNGNIPFGNSQSDINIGTYDFQNAVQLKIWSENPNGQDDPNPYNDTVTKLVYPALCGEYTIGGINPDFQTFNAAVSALTDIGIICPVVFKVRDGEYIELVVINNIEGSSEQNTVTFESESGDSTAVSLIFGNPENGIVQLINAQYINFKKIGFQSGWHTGSLDISGNSNHIKIENCYNIGDNAINISEGAYEIQVSNNYLNTNYGSTIFNSSNICFTKNKLNRIQIFSSQNIEITRNRFAPHRSGISIENCDSVCINNNNICVTGINPENGIGLINSSQIEVYFNSINVTNTDQGQESNGLIILNGDQINIRNNIFNIKEGGYPIFISNATQGFTLNYNDYHSPSGLIGKYNDTDYYLIEDWRNATGQDNNSLSENPFYTTDTDLSMNQVLLNNKAIPISGINYDIDSTLRNVTEPDIGAKEYDPCQPDAGINKVTAPINPTGQGNQEVKVILQNQGSTNLSSAIINWRVNGELQLPYTWNGLLAVDENIEVNLGTYNFEGGYYLLTIWTTQPNGVFDCNPNNDTTSVHLTAPLCGTYFIGGANSDFSNFAEAVSVLNTAGVTCAVTFKVRDGEYPEQILINKVTGASEQNTITFESESGDSTAVILRYYVWRAIVVNLKQAVYINFKKIGFKGDYSLFIDDSSSNINIERCYFEGGELAIKVQTGSQEINILNSTFYNVQYNAVLGINANGIKVDGNHIINGSSGIFLISTNASDVNNNIININPGNLYYSSGIYLESCDSINIYNNFISTEGIVFGGNGIYLKNSQHSGIYFNSLNIFNADIEQESKGLLIEGGDQNIVKNNIFKIKKTGYPVFITEGTQNFILNYNNYYRPDGLIGKYDGTDYFSIEEWKTVTEQDNSSYTENPLFTSDFDLSINQILLNNKGIPITWINYDINSNLRNPTEPDLGAKEYNPCQPDAGINEVTAPLNPIQQGNQAVKVILQNQGLGTLSSVLINWKINNEMQSPFTWTGNLANNENTEVNIGNYKFSEGLYSIIIWTTQPNGQNDCNPFNDTTYAQRATALCGSYNIGGTNPDFTTISDAITVLEIAGITCPVTFSIRDGEYVERLLINEIQGSSEQNTVTFESESGDSTQVIIYNGHPYLPAIILKGVKNIIFNNLSIKKYYGGESILIENFSENIVISNCMLISEAGARGLVLKNWVKNISIINNFIYTYNFLSGNGDKGVLISDAENVLISGNKIQGYPWAGISGSSILTNLHINENKIITCGTQYGLALNFTNDSVFISNNTLIDCGMNVTANGDNGYCLIDGNRVSTSISSAITLSTQNCMVTNNYISISGINIGNGINAIGCNNTKIVYNSINVLNSNISNSKCILISGGNLLDIKNNIFLNSASGYCVSCENLLNNPTLDYNNYYSLASNIGITNGLGYSSFSSWASAIGGEANGKNMNPYFANDSSYRVYQRGLNGAGIPVQDILFDINGNIRNDQAPDIGAWEFTVDFGITQVLSPTESCTHNVSDSLTIWLRQFGDIPFTNIRLAYQLDNEPIVYDSLIGTIYNDIFYTFQQPVNISNQGDYTIKCWLMNNFDDNRYNDTIWVERHSYPEPVVDFDFVGHCEGEAIQFTGMASIPPPFTIASYEWILGDMDTLYVQNPDYAFQQSGAIPVTFRAWSDMGCYGEITKTVMVYPISPVEIIIEPDKNPVCSGEMVTFTSLVTNEGSSPVFQWQVNGINVENGNTSEFSYLPENGNTSEFSYLPENGDTVICILQSDIPCSENNPATSNIVVMGVSEMIDPGSIFMQDTILTCGAGYLLEAAEGFLGYAWDSGDTTQFVSVDRTDWYKCTVTNGGCFAKDSVFVSIINPEITPHEAAVYIGNPITLSVAYPIGYLSKNGEYQQGVYFDLDDFEGGPGSSDNWTERNGVSPQIVSNTAYRGNYSLYFSNGWGRNFEGGTLEQGQPAGYYSEEYPYMSMAYKIPSGSHTTMLVHIQNIGWRGIAFTQGEQLNCYGPKVASWNEDIPVTTDNQWHYKTINLHEQLNQYLGAGNYKIEAVIFHDACGDYGVSGEFWIDEFSITANLPSDFPVTFNWSTGDTTTSITVTPTETTTYYCTISNGISSCMDSVTVNVTDYLVATDDTGNPVNGLLGGQALANVLLNDSLYGLPVLPSEINLSQVSTTNSGINLDAVSGEVNVAPGTPAGTYYVVYEICEIAVPSHCDQAIVTVPVAAPEIVANDDTGDLINGLFGGISVPNVLENDLLNGNPVDIADITLVEISSTNAGVSLNPATGEVSVAPGTPAGNYYLEYEICEILNPTNCDQATVTIPVYEGPNASFCLNGQQAESGTQYYFCSTETVAFTLCEVLSGTPPFSICWTINIAPDCKTNVNLDDPLFNEDFVSGTYEIQLISLIDNLGYSASDLSMNNYTITIVTGPEASAGSDHSICEGNSYMLETATANNFSTLLWTGGDGTFEPSAEILNPLYVPGPQDVENGSVELCLSASPEGPCTSDYMDCMTLFIQKNAIANAGIDIITCESDMFVELNGVIENVQSIEWTTNSFTGFIDDPNAPSTYYYFSYEDIQLGSVELCLTAIPKNPCFIPDTDCLTLSITKNPEANAGSDKEICEGESLSLDEAFVNNEGTIEWTSSGDGYFNNPALVNPNYSPGPGDIATGSLQLCITAYPQEGCSNVDSDCMNLTIKTVLIDLGPDREFACADYDTDNSKWLPVELTSTIIGDYISIEWTTDGDGTFDDTSSPTPNYYPGPSDIWDGNIEICINVVAAGDCQFAVSECIHVYIPQQLIYFNEDRWLGISSYLETDLPTVPEVMEPLVLIPGSKHLVNMVDRQGKYYWPEPVPPQATLGDWMPIGYKLKVKNTPACLPIYGDSLADQTFDINGSFTYLPVLTNVPTDIETLFAGHLQDILLIYHWAESQLWTPIASDFTELYPGYAYLLVNKFGYEPYTITYPDFVPDAPHLYPIQVKKSSEVNNSPWSDVANTALPHIFLFTENAMSRLLPGDILGVFNESNECFGMADYGDKDEIYKLVAMGNNGFSKDERGFNVNDKMTFKVYRQSIGEELEVSFIYDTQFPSSDGLFANNGVSMIKDIVISTTSITEPFAESYQLSVYPNPASVELNIVSNQIISEIQILNNLGQVVYESNLDAKSTVVDVSMHPKGIYLVAVKSENEQVTVKRVSIY